MSFSLLKFSSINVAIGCDSKFAITMLKSILKLTIVSVAIVVNGCSIAILESFGPGPDVNSSLTFKSSNTFFNF